MGAGGGGAARRWGIVAVAAAAGLLLWQARGIREPASSGSAAAAGERVTAAIGRRGIAVIEPGGALSWVVDGDTVVTQAAGNVFYRVDRGGPFRVETPQGTVRVTGTCFRVELMTMKKHWYAAAGAAVGAAIVVTVYEGSVIFAGKGGEEREVRAGQALTAGPEGDVHIGGAEGEAVADLAPELEEDASREELLARARAQRAEILALRRRVAELEASSSARGAGVGESHDASGRPWFDPSPEDLARFAEECRVRYDLPPFMSTEPFQFGPRMAEEAGLSDAELAGVNRVLAELHREHLAKLRALHIEVTGDTARADELSPQAMWSELRDKSARGDAERANQRIARERAGLSPPPSDLSSLPPIERYMRLQAALGDLTEQRLAEVIGRSRARELREKHGGWGWRSEQAGCPDEGSELDVASPR